MTYSDKISEFFARLAKEPMNSATQLIYLHLLHQGDLKRGEFEYSDRDLMQATGLTKQAVTEGKRHLKNVGLIDFVTVRDNPRIGTKYRLTSGIRDVSPAVRLEWVKCAGEEPNIATSEELQKLELEYGNSEVAAAIRRALINRKYECINIFMVKCQLERSKRDGEVKRRTESHGGAGRYREETELPPGYGED